MPVAIAIDVWGMVLIAAEGDRLGPVDFRSAVNNSLGFGQVTLADRKSVESINPITFGIRPGFGREVIFEILPVIAALIIRAQRAAGIVAAMHHAVLAARVARDAVHHAVVPP